MLRLWLLIVAFLQCSSCSCPSGYSLQYDGICTSYKGSSSHYFTYLHGDAVNVCKGATTILIRNQEEQDYWMSAIDKAYPTALGIQCNTKTDDWEWDDGSTIEFKPSSYNINLNANCTPYQSYSWYISSAGIWTFGSGSSGSLSTFTIYCMTPLPPLAPSDDECADFASDNENDGCYQVGKQPETWIEAQTICKSFSSNVASVHTDQENSFIRRLAVSRGEVNGVFLGATVSGKATNLSWIDGTPWDYTNFAPGFPIDGLGGCVAMDTNNVGGEWVNVDCNGKMAFACVRREGDKEPSCDSSVRTEGEIIYSPGFPNNASAPCDFFLKVDTGKLVEVEILLLEANSCCDRLVLTEGSLGGNIIATLTGEVASGTRFTTNSTNVMRVSWQPNGGVNVRGMMITFRGV